MMNGLYIVQKGVCHDFRIVGHSYLYLSLPLDIFR